MCPCACAYAGPKYFYKGVVLLIGDLTLAERFLTSYVEVFSRRGRIFAVMNVLFFDSIFVFVLLSEFLCLPLPYEGEPVWVLEWFLGLHWLWMILAIFLFNLVLSGFVFLTLSGLVFFPVSVVVLVIRGALWGIMLNQQSAAGFFLVLPTLILEGEGYVLASVAGTVLGLSWLKPDWIYGGERFSRLDALKTALREALRLIFLVAVLLFLAAVVETFTITHT